MTDWVRQTAQWSLAAQWFTGVLGGVGLLQSVPPSHTPVYTCLQLEMGVQLVEFVFYVWALWTRVPTDVLAERRYRDWVVTTPVMLLSLMYYFYYERERQAGRPTDHLWPRFWAHHQRHVWTVVGCNVIMLAAGYAGEQQWLGKWSSTLVGFGGYTGAFGVLWTEFARFTPIGRRMWTLVATTWALYGVAYLAAPGTKNVAYNGLDVVAKNVFGLYLTLQVFQAGKN